MTNQPPLGAAVHITGSTLSFGVDDYTLLAGKTSAAHDVYNDVTVQVTQGASPGRGFAVEARVRNSAAAFRFELDTVVPQAPHRKLRPVLYYSWEATAFNVNEAGKEELAEKAASLGVERFIMDDGWFGEHNK